MTAGFLESPELSLVFWPISTILLLFGWSSRILLFPSPPFLVPILWWLYWAHQLQLASPSPSMFHSYFQSSRKVQVFISFVAFLQFYPVVSWNIKVHYSAGSIFFVDLNIKLEYLKIYQLCVNKDLVLILDRNKYLKTYYS